MRVKYDKEVDIVCITLANLPVAESDEEKPGIVPDYAHNGSIAGIEILEASKKLPQPNRLEYEVA